MQHFCWAGLHQNLHITFPPKNVHAIISSKCFRKKLSHENVIKKIAKVTKYFKEKNSPKFLGFSFLMYMSSLTDIPVSIR